MLGRCLLRKSTVALVGLGHCFGRCRRQLYRLYEVHVILSFWFGIQLSYAFRHFQVAITLASGHDKLETLSMNRCIACSLQSF